MLTAEPAAGSVGRNAHGAILSQADMNQREKRFICFRGAAGSNSDTPNPGNFKKCSPIHLQELLLENQNIKITQVTCKKDLATKKQRLKTLDAF